jgi:1-acyl-sn-glycerol-3-phosphate acyltransferase
MRPIISFIKLAIFGIWSFLAIVFGGLLYLVRIKNGMTWIAKYFWSPFVIPLIGGKLKIENGDRIDPKQSYLIMANHNSFIDIPVLFKAMPFYTYFIAKKEIKKIPLLGWYVGAYGMIYIDRSDSAKAKVSIAHAAKLIEAGKHVIIFPEGTKSKDGKIAAFKKGGFHLAEQSNVPILPIKIEGATQVWPNKQPFKLGFGRITVKVGKPITANELEKMELQTRVEYVRALIENL